MESEALATLILNKLRAGIKVILMFLVPCGYFVLKFSGNNGYTN